MLIYLSLVLSLCLQLGLACVPVRPGEDLPCPSVPFIETIEMYLVSGLEGPMDVDGAMVYSCKDPTDSLLSVEGTMVMALEAGATISCKPNSGIFVTKDGKAVGGKKFNCGQIEKPCPTFPDAMTIEGVAKREPPVMEKLANGDTVWSCLDPSYLYSVITTDPNNPMKLGKTATVTCRRQSEALTVIDGTAPERAPMQDETFACGTVLCQTCPRDVLADVESAVCANLDSAFCTSKPVVGEGADGCAAVSCPSGSLFLLVPFVDTSPPSATMVDPAQVKCLNGGWRYLDGTTFLPRNAVLACAQACTCELQSFGDGSNGLCPEGKLCTSPGAIVPCSAACPAKSTAIYKDIMGTVKTSETIKCLGNDWIEVGSDVTAGVTCQFEDGEGFVKVQPKPPTDNVPDCPALASYVCTAEMMCDDTQLIYFITGEGTYNVVCESGSLLTNGQNVMVGQPVRCLYPGQWEPPVPITQATCVLDKSAVKDCLDTMDTTVADTVAHSCSYGACRLSCPPGKQFTYMYLDPNSGPDLPGTNEQISCKEGVLNTVEGHYINPPDEIKCE